MGSYSWPEYKLTILFDWLFKEFLVDLTDLLTNIIQGCFSAGLGGME